METNKLHILASEGWRCPSCGRTKGEVVRRKGNRRIAKLAEHHDHLENVPIDFMHEVYGNEWRSKIDKIDLKYRTNLNRIKKTGNRFTRTVTCEDCNNADTAAKKLVEAHKNFSFCPSEVSCFIIPITNGKNQINQDAVRSVYSGAIVSWTKAYEWKMEELYSIFGLNGENLWDL